MAGARGASAVLLSAAATLAAAAEVKLATFDGARGTTFDFKELNDPVMGGRSTGTWRVDSAGHFGVLDGEVVDVPKLKAPGFITAAADGAFPDASSAAGGDLVLLVRSSTPEYKGFRVTFASGTLSPMYACAGGGSIPFSRGCYKAKFSVPAGDDFVAVRIPLSSFSDKWSPSTGEQTTTCAADQDVCPTAAKLQKIKRVSLWAEGVGGKAHLEVLSVSVASPGARLERVAGAAAQVPLATFDGARGTSFDFKELNDPVMGGRSTGTWRVDSAGHFGVFDGEVLDVPSLKAPGFIKAAADGAFPDASSVAGGALVLLVRSSTPEYKGFRVSLASGTLSPAYACSGGGSIPLSRGCYKAKFSVPAGDDFVEVRVPFSSFSDRWSPATGEQTKTCADSPDVCLTAKALGGIKRVELWAEGADGRAHLEVRSIVAEAPALAAGVAAPPPAAEDFCSGPVQPKLRYGISGRTQPTVPVPVDENETLAEAVCCDRRTQAYAEPQFLYQAPDVQLFAQLKGVTTFYDSVCGVPLFRAPVNRTLAEFQADTDEHGWPSFRPAEVVREHVREDKNGFVFSSCGTHLGSYLPDAKGPRWCMDLSCIAGNPREAALVV